MEEVMPQFLGVEDLVGVMLQNQRKTGNPLGLDGARLARWAQGLKFNASSGTYLYTGGLYQMAAYIDSFIEALERLEGSVAGGVGLGLVKALGRLGINLSSLYSSVAEKEAVRYEGIIRNLYTLLVRQGYEFGFLGSDEQYSGVLFYDMGFDSEFQESAERLTRMLRDRGVKRLITMDPHSTLILKEVYPKFVDAFDVEVNHYLEVLEPGGATRSDKLADGVFAVHDPCLLARNLGLSDRYRDFALKAGLKIAEPQLSRRSTFCCGGPIENIAPRVSGAIAEKRCSQLGEAGGAALVACPICLSNLGRACKRKGSGPRVVDLLEVVG
ncbi:hypothetical protein B9Q06_09125 [Candidatus Marsarchaeota G2 archaeon ECH_B_2]|uniref:Cysteine-rich domain-containing protein n=4 Tax=Candidatus Marsarchaeota group 2 TaxID=2203771 RepID=A0A2R6B728_9ARCH|nr:MAG: hypothetical protein B9Q06_09125 [Candidatus Marsarchaeota G2 archaeon ECH_B_2]PSN98891.1 MAG: hypothetical protein B9Q07_08320 [Candidatus Marsarchaeota G2 archaeon ECH_B_3]PSO01009.1 MAG: hypothetical protein B9Q05_09680 [Candidatus Marsarchaeota G2 archaeon ECH_B_1]